MAWQTWTINAKTIDGYISSIDASFPYSYSNSAYATSSTVTAFPSETYALVGQYDTAFGWKCYESFLAFPVLQYLGSTPFYVASAYLDIYGQTSDTDVDFTIQARVFDYGSAVDTSDWRTPDTYSECTLISTFNTSGWSDAGYNRFTNESTFVPNIASYLNSDGDLKVTLLSSRHMAFDQPTITQNEWVQFYSSDNASNKPRLVLEGTSTPRRLRGYRSLSAQIKALGF